VQRNILKGLGAKDQSQFSRGIANSADARGDAVAAFKKENVWQVGEVVGAATPRDGAARAEHHEEYLAGGGGCPGDVVGERNPAAASATKELLTKNLLARAEERRRSEAEEESKAEGGGVDVPLQHLVFERLDKLWQRFDELAAQRRLKIVECGFSLLTLQETLHSMLLQLEADHREQEDTL
jgi:hypothetical protein